MYYIGLGSKLIGNFSVSDNDNIAVNDIVLTDVPDNCTVGGISGRIIFRKRN